MIEFLYLLLKYDENGAGRLAGLELGREWMGKKIALGLLLVGFQGVIENELKVWGGGCSGLSVGHMSRRKEIKFVCAEARTLPSDVDPFAT